MTGDAGYGEEGYSVMGRDHYTIEAGPSRAWGVLFFFLGGIVGATIALLATPQSGSKTRQQLKEASLGARDKAETYYGQVRERVGHAVDRGKDLATEKKPILTAAIQAGKEAYEKEKERRMKE